MSPAPPTTPPCPRSDRAAPTMTTRPPGHRPGGRVVVTPRGNPYETRLRRRDRSGHRSTALRPSAVEAFRLTGRRRGQCWPRGMALIRASFVQTLSRRPERKPVRSTSYPATTRMRRSRSNVLHSARESAYTAGQQHSLPPHTRKVTGSIPVGTTPAKYAGQGMFSAVDRSIQMMLIRPKIRQISAVRF